MATTITGNTIDVGPNKLVANSAGNVGIGTASPAKPLDVTGDIRTSTGILFGTDTAAANTLSDYEEGTFNPFFHAADTNCTGLSFTGGYYTKIGRLVNLSFNLEATITSASAETSIKFVLPLTAINSGSQAAGGSANFYMGSGANRFGIGAIYNGTTSNTTSHIYIPAYAMNNSGGIGETRVSMTYLTP
jgi:hypothetical protein